MNASFMSQRGFTIFEIVLSLSITMVLMAGLLPAMTSTIRDARTARATTDMTDLGLQINQFLTDTGNTLFTIDGTNGAGSKLQLMVSDGDMPGCTTAGAPCAGGLLSWNRAVDNVGGITDFLERHLVTNNPRGNSANDYPVGAAAWRGPYLNGPINPDPWGNRYMVNAEAFPAGGNDVIVLSAGKDETVDTIFQANGFATGGDDLFSLVQN